MGSLALLQQIFLTLELNPGLPHCRWILYQLSYRGSLASLSASLPTVPLPHAHDDWVGAEPQIFHQELNGFVDNEDGCYSLLALFFPLLPSLAL